jgi:uncharacterized membrane protein
MTDQNTAPLSRTGSAVLGTISALSLAGLAAGIYLAIHYYSVRNGTLGFRSTCNLGPGMNCDVVSASPWAELVAGIPLASFGAGWFLSVFIVSLFARLPELRREWIRALFAMSVFSVCFSGFYFYLMAGPLGTFCLFCLGIDLVSVLTLVLSASLKPELPAHAPVEWRKWKPILAIAAGALLVAVVGLRSFDESHIPAQQLVERADSILGSPALAIETAGFPSVGPADAPVTVVEFSDFQCPFCRLGAFNLNAAMNGHPGKVRMVFRNFPLDSACNRTVEQAMHPLACDAAKAAVCSQKQGKFQAVYETLFENQASFQPTDSGRPEVLADRKSVV